ncbi:MAG: hypothetical protein COB12_02835 [Flavobacterium sp.]|nr:MAG: hypothetical protein COB12_02835 [Flavobacterium sp.]
MKWILKLLLTAVAVFVLQKILPGITVASYTDAIWAALIIGLLNSFVRPLLIFLTLPATLITMGLFLFVINALMIMMAGNFLDGFTVASFWWALLFSILLSILQPILHSVLGEEKQQS